MAGVSAGIPIAVVVCTRDRPAQLAECLPAVRTALRPHDELVVVDSASRYPDACGAAVALGLRIVRCDRPGLSRARNAGIEATTAPVVCFTDDDCRPEASWLDAVAAAFDSPTVGFVAGRVDAAADATVVVTVSSTSPPARFHGLVEPMTIGHGANMAFRREVLDAIGGFDELLGAGGRFRSAEDHDAFWRTLYRGWDGRYEPAAAVVHEQWRTRKDAIRLSYGYGIGAGAFARKALDLDRDTGRALLRHRLWDNGLAQAWRDARAGHETAAACSVAKAIGTAVGALRSSRLCVLEGRFVSTKK